MCMSRIPTDPLGAATTGQSRRRQRRGHRISTLLPVTRDRRSQASPACAGGSGPRGRPLGPITVIGPIRVIASSLSERTDPPALVIGPTGVALSGGGTLYVADSVNNRI